jgi:hypothetical protein
MTSASKQSGPKDTRHYFSATNVQQLRRKLQKALQVPETDETYPGDGLYLSPVDPSDAVRIVTHVHLKPGYVLQGYQYISGSNGNGFVYAIPEEARLPDPYEHVHRLKEVVPGVHLPYPEPPNALPHFMDAIEGDGSPRSFLEASILMRELEEFGAIWHGCDWADHEIIYADPFDPANRLPKRLAEYGSWSSDDWSWIAPKPRDWRPCVKLEGGGATFEFISFSAFDGSGLFRHLDTYKQGSMQPSLTREDLANGPFLAVH